MKMAIASFVGCLLTVLLTAVAFGATIPEPWTDPAGFFGWVISLFQGKNWPALIGAAVILVVWLIRTKAAWLTDKWTWLKTRWGGYFLAALLAALPVVAQGLVDGLGWAEVLRRVVMALAIAISGWQVLKDTAANK